MERLAQSVNLSPSRLRALFRTNLKSTPKQHLNRLILQRAKALAEETDLTIAQILDEVGAGDPRNFRRKFKKAFGVTLSQCRLLSQARIEEESDLKDSGIP